MTTPAGDYRQLPIDQVRPSKTNPRKHFDEAALAELAADIKDKGVVEPILVRPLENSEWLKKEIAKGIVVAEKGRKLGNVFEIVAGERRYRAAKLAGLGTIPAIVREYSDQQAREVQVIENLQRRDLHWLEEAEGFVALIKDYSYTVDVLAAKVSKSESYIRDKLKAAATAQLAAVREAAADGRLSESVAALLGRLPNAKLREQAAKEVLTPAKISHYPWRQQKEPLSFRQAKEYLGKHYTVELKGAPFPLKLADLAPGSCQDCPKRAGNNREEYPDARADVCTDPACYRDKCAAWTKKMLADASVLGHKVLTKTQAAEVFNKYHSGGLAYNAPYVALDAPCYDASGSKTRTYKQLLEKHLDNSQVAVGVDTKGDVRLLVDKKLAMSLIKKHHSFGGGANSNGSRSSADAKWKKQQADERREKELANEALRRCMGLVAAKAEQLAAGPVAIAETLRLIVAGIVDRTWADVCRQIEKRRGLRDTGGKSVTGGVHRSNLAGVVADLTEPQLLGLLAEIVAGGYGLQSYGREPLMEAFWSHFGVDRKAVLKQVKDEKAAAKTAKAKPSKNGKAHANSKAEPPAKPPIAGDTALTDLVVGDTTGLCNAIGKWTGERPPTVATLFARVGSVRKGESYTSKLYAYLRDIPGLTRAQAHEIGDALVDAGLVNPDGPAPLPTPRPTAEPAKPNGKPKRGEHKPGCTFEKDLAEMAAKQPVGQCRVCRCTEADCTVCVERTGEPCEWTSPAQDLCSACLSIVNAELTTLPDLSAGVVKLINSGSCKHVCDVLGKGDAYLAQHFSVSVNARRELQTAVDGWVKSQLAHDTEGNELMPSDCDDALSLPTDAARPLEDLDLPPKVLKKLLKRMLESDLFDAQDLTTVELSGYVEEHDDGPTGALAKLGLTGIEAEYVLGAMQTLAEEAV